MTFLSGNNRHTVNFGMRCGSSRISVKGDVEYYFENSVN